MPRNERFDWASVTDLESTSFTTDQIDSTTTDTEELSVNAHFVFPADGFSGLKATVSNASDGDIVYVLSGTFVNDSPPWNVSTKIDLKGWGYPTLTIADGLDDNSDDVIRFRTGSGGSSIKGFEIDGNLQNQTVSDYGSGSNPGAQGIHIGDGNDGFVDEITVERCYIHDIIRSGLVGVCRDGTFRNLVIENSGYDHWIYAAGFNDCLVEDISCEGFARGSGISIGTGGFPSHDNIIRTVTVRNIEPTPNASNLANIIQLRDTDASGTLVDDISIDGTDAQAITRIYINHPATVSNVEFETRDSGQPPIEVTSSAQGSTIRDVDLLISNNIDDQNTTGVQIKADDVTVDNVTAAESGVPINIRGFTVDGADDVSIVNSVADVDFRAYQFGNVINRLWSQNLYDKRSAGVLIGSDASVAENGYAEESANAEEPQGNYRDGTIVDFTDSGDGSGSGRYIITRANGAVLL
jgi:hypothetical protein